MIGRFVRRDDEAIRVAAKPRPTAAQELGTVLAAAVSHGLALTLWLASVLPALDAPDFWSRLTFPDAWTVDADRAKLTRLVGW